MFKTWRQKYHAPLSFKNCKPCESNVFDLNYQFVRNVNTTMDQDTSNREKYAHKDQSTSSSEEDKTRLMLVWYKLSGNQLVKISHLMVTESPHFSNEDLKQHIYKSHQETKEVDKTHSHISK